MDEARLLPGMQQKNHDHIEEGTMPIIPYAIDNQQHTMSEVLNHLLAHHSGRSLDIATAYFNVGGWQLLHEGLQKMGSVRLLLGDEPELGADLGLHEAGAKPIKGLIRELSEESFNQRTMQMVEELVAFLMQDRVQVRLYTESFLHAKGYLFYGDRSFTRIAPLAAIVGSSNFTRAGLLTNKELNLVHRASLEPHEVDLERIRGIMEEEDREQLFTLSGEQRAFAAAYPGLLALHELTLWYRQQWRNARDFKAELIELLNASKFGRKAYTPYQVYTKAIFEYFRDELDNDDDASTTRSAVELSEFQEDAVKKARKILLRYDGVLIADSVGLGKTWIGKKLLEDYAYHRRYKAVVICPAALQKMWREELLHAGIAALIITQEMLGREDFDLNEAADADLVLVDESHNFRNHNTGRYENLERLLTANNRRGRISNERKKLILLTATPISNNIFDLYNQVNLFTGGDRSYFSAAGIGDLPRYFAAARRLDQQQESSIALFNLLEEVVIRRTRPFIKQAYPNATIQGQPIHWPERKLKTIRYHLEATYSGIYTQIVEQIEQLRLAPYCLESYKRQGIERDSFEEGREEALVGIFKSRYLKRLESSIAAFRISVRRALEFLETFERYLHDGKVIDSTNFQKAMRFLAREDEEDDATPPSSRSSELDAHSEARNFIEGLPTLEAWRYDMKRLLQDIHKDIEALRTIWSAIVHITNVQDRKLNTLKELLEGELKGKKVLIFTSYKDTSRFLYNALCAPDAATQQWRNEAGEPHIQRMDSDTDTKERARIVAAFAPHANHHPELAGTDKEIGILISTDVLSEGQNLQDCGVLINYDLHWNPTRLVQRAGRIDRIGSSFDTLWIMNMFPDDGLERLLGLVESLSQKIAIIDRTGLLDASILGEIAHPQNFNTLRRIAEEDNKVLEEQENFAELVSSEFLLQHLKNLFNRGMRDSLEELPDGIHSGLLRNGARGVFFYFVTKDKPTRRGQNGQKQPKANRTHYWRYVDLTEDPEYGQIEENRYLITNLIQCQPDSERYVPPSSEVNIFWLQERVIASIIQSSAQQSIVDEVPRILEPIQQTISTLLRQYLHHPQIPRQDVVAALQKVNVPQPRVHIKAMRKAYQAYKTHKQVLELIAAINQLEGSSGEPTQPAQKEKELVKREDLKLICFEYVWQ